jgi:hypothetical protein
VKHALWGIFGLVGHALRATWSRPSYGNSKLVVLTMYKFGRPLYLAHWTRNKLSSRTPSILSHKDPFLGRKPSQALKHSACAFHPCPAKMSVHARKDTETTQTNTTHRDSSSAPRRSTMRLLNIRKLRCSRLIPKWDKHYPVVYKYRQQRYDSLLLSGSETSGANKHPSVLAVQGVLVPQLT